MEKYFELPTVGEILKEEFIKPFGINQNILAQKINVPAGRISEIINGKRIITADTDLRLTKYFGLSEGYFLRIQNKIELTKIKREKKTRTRKNYPIQKGRCKNCIIIYDFGVVSLSKNANGITIKVTSAAN